MTNTETSESQEDRLPPVAGARVVYLGPVAPHWGIHTVYGDQAVVDAMPFEVEDLLEFELPGSDSVGDWGD